MAFPVVVPGQTKCRDCCLPLVRPPDDRRYDVAVCECWKRQLTPEQREDAQDVIVARRMAELDRKAFEERRRARDEEKVRRGQFGNRKASVRRRAV